MDNPLSIVPTEGAANDFPVLKAFQEYIDAEQAKARKRMLGLSVFFIVLLVVVVVTFVVILTTVLNRNQALSDRLLDYALEERQNTVQQIPAPAVQPQQAQPSADVIKKFLERIDREQAAMKAAFEKERQEAAAKAAEAERLRQQELIRLQEDLSKERAKAKAEAEKKEAIERHRRRLYPDYYRMQTEDRLVVPPPASTYRRQPQPIMPAEASQEPVNLPKSTPPPPPKPKAESPLSTLKPVTYFNVDDEDDVPFLIETPKQNK